MPFSIQKLKGNISLGTVLDQYTTNEWSANYNLYYTGSLQSNGVMSLIGHKNGRNQNDKDHDNVEEPSFKQEERENSSSKVAVKLFSWTFIFLWCRLLSENLIKFVN
jgi:hypothetical protein